ncbi:peptide-binding protein [Candidatus Magnetominusculus xianensis]|uniref:Peptide-binding protein n=1 Tax=Candidatus Magnetominusculus xianensis TaxID=1748249 RepID=A0ABR5SIE8_9BACT|nr:peptide-binding protein [Candidatus Magnetominusculus xianensis]KWT92658.1 peptide-binding protein [Candidatus Magnetominusculus xianensis]MBF0403791.1 peptide-binding protein [Nitrospirota bacterium]
MKTLLIVKIFVLTIALSACDSRGAGRNQAVTPSQANATPVYGGTLIEGMTAEPSVLIPVLAGDSASHSVSGNIFNGLVKYAPDLSTVGDLAESWEISPDGLTITFHLKKGVRWTDGADFTAEDVLFGFQTIISDKTPTPYKEDFLQVKTAETPDNHTFRVTYGKPFAPALNTWGSLVVLPKHLLQGVDITKTPLIRKPVGMGPYKLDTWVSGQELTLSSNQDYFEGRPYIDKYVYRIIPDQSTMFMALKAGEVDLMGVTPIQFKRQTDSEYFNANFNKYRYPVFSYTYLGFNLRHPFFGDKRVRQAIAHAIDKQEIIDIVLYGLATPSTGPYVPNTWPYNPNVKKYDFNPAKAKALLAEAGWIDTGGILSKNGVPFEFTILTNMGNPLRMKTAAIIQWKLKQVGIKVNIRALEWSTFLNEFIDKKRFDAVILGWGIGMDGDQYDIWHSSKTKDKEFNFVSYSNSEVDALLETGRRTFDIDKRKAAYYKIQAILADELPYLFLYVPDALVVVNKKFMGIEPTTIGIGYNLPKWYVSNARNNPEK